MANLYITEQNSVLRKTGDRLIVQKDDEILLDVQCHKIDAVLIFGNVQFTTQAVHELFEHGIEMAILTRTGRLVGQITSPTTRNIFLRIEQFKKYQDENFKLELSRTIVAAKIKNGLNLVRSFSYNHPEIDFKKEIRGLKQWLNKVGTAENNQRLLGLEGGAAKLYYTAFGKMLLGDFDFSGRKKRPPPDPVNAMLSLSYTMAFNEIASLLDGLGFDPYLGFFHRADYGRASLAADLVEEFRAPIADRFVLNSINGRTFKKEDFKINPKGSGVSFRRDALKRYFSVYEKFLNNEFEHPDDQTRTTLRKCIRRQAEKLAAAIQNDQAYMPFELIT
ncbi:MAG: CRISPR-associated endonuclease Cas1 [Deltaproteobacteria bacterium]|nr:MAG: CRISPR-associated endonuclease Cas1 [Deltaproteobacteria bacterium]